jgi:hypothetical protein
VHGHESEDVQNGKMGISMLNSICFTHVITSVTWWTTIVLVDFFWKQLANFVHWSLDVISLFDVSDDTCKHVQCAFMVCLFCIDYRSPTPIIRSLGAWDPAFLKLY